MPGKEYSEVAPSEEVADKAATPSGGSVASRCDPGPCIRDSKHPWVAFFHIFFKVRTAQGRLREQPAYSECFCAAR
jgi:hypothetical protein